MLYRIQTNKQKLPDSYKDGLIVHNNVLQYREHTTYFGIILDDRLSLKCNLISILKRSQQHLDSNTAG